MGVRGLWNVISSAQEYCPLAEIGGQTVTVDLSIWVCRDKSTLAQINLHFRNLFFRILNLLRQNTLPVAVTDGVAPHLKLSVIKKRLQKRDGRCNERSNSKVTLSRPQFSRLNQQCITLLDALGLPYVQSPGEAEAMCALMNAAGLVEACITNDGDAFLYGAHKVYRHFSMDSRDSSVQVYRLDRIKKILHFDQIDFIIMGLLLGCDYWPSGVCGLGKANVLRLLGSLRESKSNRVKFFKWLISTCPVDVQVVANGPYVKFSDRKIAQLWSKVGMALQTCPVDEIFTEFLSTSQQRSWTLPSSSYLNRWRRPDPRAVVKFCSFHLDWSPVYALHHLLPIIALWDLRHPQLYKSVSNLNSKQDPIDDAVILKPIRIIKKRTVNFVESFEVEWKRMEFDIWTPRNCSESLDVIPHIPPTSEPLASDFDAKSSENLTDFYRFPIPIVEFQNIYPDMCAEFDRLSVKPRKCKTLRDKKTRSRSKDGANIVDLIKGLNLGKDSELESNSKCSHGSGYLKGINKVITTFRNDLPIIHTPKDRLLIWDSDSSIDEIQSSKSSNQHSSDDNEPIDARSESFRSNKFCSAFGLITRYSSDPSLFNSGLQFESSLLVNSPQTHLIGSFTSPNQPSVSLSSDHLDLSPFKMFHTPKSLKDRIAYLDL